MLHLRGALSYLLRRSRNGSRDATLLQYASHHDRRPPGALLPPSTPLPRFLAAFSSASAAAAAPFGEGGADPSASATPGTAIPSSLVDHLIHSYGFSPDEAAGVCERLKRSKPPQNPTSLLSFFKGKGLDAALIRKIVARRPTLLYARVEKTLAPKFRAFEEIGVTGSALLKILERNSNFVVNSLEKKLMPNISLLREECGIYGQRLLQLMRTSPLLLGRSSSSLTEIIERVRELGLHPGSPSFHVGLRIMHSFSRRTVDRKLAYFRSLGWREEDILSVIRLAPPILGLSERKTGEKLVYLKSLGWTEEETFFAVRHSPFILGLSERNIKDSIDFFVQEIGWSMSSLAAKPGMLLLSTGKRVKPRYNVYRILKSRHLPEGDWSLPYLLSLTERKFLDKVIIKYKDRFPELNGAYGACS